MVRNIDRGSKINTFSDFKCKECGKSVAPLLIEDHLDNGHTVTETVSYPYMNPAAKNDVLVG